MRIFLFYLDIDDRMSHIETLIYLILTIFGIHLLAQSKTFYFQVTK